MEKGGAHGPAGTTAMMIAALFGGAVAAVVAVFLLLLCSAAISTGLIGQNYELQMVITACIIGGLCGGRMTCRQWGRSPLLAGLSAGAVFALIQLTVGMLVYESAMDLNGGGLGVVAGCLCGGAASSLFGLGSRKKKKRTY